MKQVTTAFPKESESGSPTFCLFPDIAVESPEREPGRGEPPPPESDQPAESAEPLSAGEEHGEQRAISPGAETIHVTVTAPAIHTTRG